MNEEDFSFYEDDFEPVEYEQAPSSFWIVLGILLCCIVAVAWLMWRF